ncbi:MAG TPA: adenosylcobinamide amidohydrolase [Mycobacteriales bacterium]|jgi:adenosylcobinamide amidohydrolase|nr:adenosylcobinamide amidohydrolase [Mycobacteriales bacterium]
MSAAPELVAREEDGIELSTLVWRYASPMRCVSTAAVGGGLVDCSWVVNAQVPKGYHRDDLDAHGTEIAAGLDLDGIGVVMLTAVNVRSHHNASFEGANVTATVGVNDPTWAADPSADSRRIRDAATSPVATPGTVNVVVSLPEPVVPAGLINLVATVTEAKCQAFADFAVAGTGTPSDAVTVICPVDGDPHPYGGPRSLWGARVACAAYDAIIAGLRDERERKLSPC